MNAPTTLPDLLTFARLREANVRRVGVFRNAKGALAHNPDGSNWNLAEWTNAMCGEAGEAANLAKKIIRGDFGENHADSGERDFALHALAHELADVVIYADLTCYRAGHDLGAMVREKFNIVSARIGCDIELNGDPDAEPGTLEARLRLDGARQARRAFRFRLKGVLERYNQDNPFGASSDERLHGDLKALLAELHD